MEVQNLKTGFEEKFPPPKTIQKMSLKLLGDPDGVV
jgi:hypothetical protein